jgi:hypothetical protein
MKYSKHGYVRNAMNIYLHISNQPHCFVVIWFAILKLYGESLGFKSPNLNLNCFVIILTLETPCIFVGHFESFDDVCKMHV